MSLSRSAWTVGAVALLGFASAAPSVNVAVRTAFGAPPYLIELLETAADENATAYFPLLDRIADGHFDSASTDQELYNTFRKLLEQDGHLGREDLSSFDYALSIHSAAPRIAAHYQFYNTSIIPSIEGEDGSGCDSWIHVPFSGQRYCSPELEASAAQSFGRAGEQTHRLPFDRVLGDPSSDKPSILYTDITSPSFREFHKTLSKTARAGKTSYRVRYKASPLSNDAPLTVSGYGVELALKRTDYIVIDDRQAGEQQKESSAASGEATLSEEEVSDLRPLSQSELNRLGLKAASFVMGSEDSFDTLIRLLQDFPKHSSSIAATSVSQEFVQEHMRNREIFAPAGYNGLWINGVQIMARDVDAYTLLEHLRKERKMIDKVRELGLTGAEAIDLLSHEAITASQTEQDAHRYDWRDENEGGDVIIWLNDLEKDKRYAEWPGSAAALLQRTYPGQLPPVRRDVHNLVIPVDFSDRDDIILIVENLQSFVKRRLPIRIGLVPIVASPFAVEQAKLVSHLLHTYGLAAVLDYLEQLVATKSGQGQVRPTEEYFAKAVDERQVRKEKNVLSFLQVLEDEEFESRLKAAQRYISRLGADEAPPVFANGVPIPRTEDWLPELSQRLTLDNRIVQQAVYEGSAGEEDYLPDLFLSKVNLRRNPLVVPEDDSEVRHIKLGDLPDLADLPSLPASSDTIERELVHLTLAADFTSIDGFNQLMEALHFQKEHDNVELAILHVPPVDENKMEVGSLHDKATAEAFMRVSLGKYENALKSQDIKDLEGPTYPQRRELHNKLFSLMDDSSESNGKVSSMPTTFKHIQSAIGIKPGEKAFILNGRVLGPLPDSVRLEKTDLETFFDYERKQRLLPAALAVQGVGLEKKAATPLSFAVISNLIALSTISDVPEGIFEAAPTVRTANFKRWAAAQTSIRVGDPATANIHVYASIDPASELAQRWIPIIKALSELNGVFTSVFLNPRDRLEEIPIKRFYRYVISSKPAFEANGSLQGLSARFSGLPADALLNMGMNVPPSWLVAPKETIHDLDNIKLSAVKSGSNIEAVYELEHILIEGHCRDTTLVPPRGVQLVLGTEGNPHSADTIIMANLGYFQFKANPGVYNLTLQDGRSKELFRIDSAGTLGYNAQLGDETTEIALMSFRGSTLFPRLSRNPGMEDEDVLEASKSTLESLADNADKLLAQAGLNLPQAGKYLSSAAKFGSDVFGGLSRSTVAAADRHADINIFSVASGHLYERMLNIMMVSVMKHTKHTVKFWFIEQFLSPSFKDFLPIMAEEYGFQYEMVTYKWPHWLRGQKEKQREIWGYKILFLDVLFPLDLDKVIFVDADQIVRTDMYELVQHDLQGAPYGFTPMCDSRTEMEGFRFWKQGYWKTFLKGLPYHISALYVVDLKKFRQIAAGDRLRQNYHALSADAGSLSNLDQDLPNHMQSMLPIHSLPQEWLWCETWCSDESLKDAKTIDLCNNPQTKEPKLDRARRQVPEWTVYDDEIAAVAKRRKEKLSGDVPTAEGEESIQERLQREDAEREKRKKEHVKDEL